jgi:P-type conjugative transfer ATPase TrbB
LRFAFGRPSLNPDGLLWVERLGEPMQQVGSMNASQAESLMGTVASTLKTHITAENPILECELPPEFLGARFEALLPPIVSGPTFTIRKKAIKVFPLTEYVSSEIMTVEQYIVIVEAVEARQNILVVGGTNSGKTTLTNAIIDQIARSFPGDRIVVIEDTGELQPKSENCVVLRTSDFVDMNRLLKATMRLRPDRIIVGEVRDGAALSLLKAWNTGHPGGVATIHANTKIQENAGAAGLIRMELLVAEATATPMQALIGEAVDLIITIEKTDTNRRVKEVVRVTGHDGKNYLTKAI